MKKRWFVMGIVFLLLVSLLLSGCGVIDMLLKPSMPTVPPSQATLKVMTHDSFYISDTIIYDFEREHSVTLEFVRSGDTGAALNRAILSKDSPQADVFYGVDNTFLSRALEAEIFEPYDSPMLEKVLDELKLEGQNEVLPVDFGEVCINYDKAYFAEKGLVVPQTLEELTKPEYEGLLAVENPATSSPGLAFLLATVAQFGEDGYLDYWQSLRDNGVVVVNDWETAYYTNFSASSGRGPQPMVVSYATSPAAEVYFAEEPPEESPTASIVGPGACFRQIEYVGILKGTQQRELAEKFIDYMLDYQFQEDIPLQMFVFPSNGEARLPEVFVKHIQLAEEPAQLEMQRIAEKRDDWINAWDEVVLR